MSDAPRNGRRTPGSSSAKPSGGPSAGPVRIPAALLVLAVLLALEALGLAVVTLLLVLQLLVAGSSATDLGSGIALAVTAAVGVAGLVLLTLGARRGAAWIRPATIVWQLLQGIVGVNALTGVGAQPVLAVVLIVPAVIGLVLCFTPAVVEATRRR